MFAKELTALAGPGASLAEEIVALVTSRQHNAMAGI
jgi:hypothetical protein